MPGRREGTDSYPRGCSTPVPAQRGKVLSATDLPGIGMIAGMNRTVKVAISLPEELLRQVDGVRRRRGESRSQYFRDAATARLTSGMESAVEDYRRGYAVQPESASEVEAAAQSAVALLASEPWG